MQQSEQDYERLIQPIEKRMIGAVWRVVGDKDDFDDAFQDALAKIWKSLNYVSRHPNPHALILRICVNAATDVLRAKVRMRQREKFEEVPNRFPDPAPSASARMSSRETQAEIFEAIAKLTRKQAEVALMRFSQEMPYDEIAEALGCSEVTARTHASRARDRLRGLLSHLAPHSSREVSK